MNRIGRWVSLGCQVPAKLKKGVDAHGTWLSRTLHVGNGEGAWVACILFGGFLLLDLTA